MKYQRTLTLNGITTLSVQSITCDLMPMDNTIKPYNVAPDQWRFNDLPGGVDPLLCKEHDRVSVNYIQLCPNPPFAPGTGTECDLVRNGHKRLTGEILFLSDLCVVFQTDGLEHMFRATEVSFEPTLTEAVLHVNKIMGAVRKKLPVPTCSEEFNDQERMLRLVVEHVVREDGK